MCDFNSNAPAAEKLPCQTCAELTSGTAILPCRIAGRVLALNLAGDDAKPCWIRLIDASGPALVTVKRGAETGSRRTVHPGDIVSLTVTRREPLVGEGLEPLTSYRRAVPFPSPGSDFYRLNREESHSTRRARLTLRARLLRQVRREFDDRGYLEIDSPQRVRYPGLEPQLSPMRSGSQYLITSPEYQLKRLLAGGMDRIYFLGHCWRDDELGSLHLSEFCLLEWYETGAGLAELMDQTERLIKHLAEALGAGPQVYYQGAVADLNLPFARLSVVDAMQRFAGIDLRGVITADELGQRAAQAGLIMPSNVDFDGLFSKLMVEHIEPQLAKLGAVFLYGFPAPLAALARLDPMDPTVAERVELYIAGVELSNGFAELIDAEQQLTRFRADQGLRRTRGLDVPDVDDRLIEALREGIPPCAGNALGVDRLLILLTGAAHISQVVPFATDEV